MVEGVVPPVQRHNLAEVCKLLNQISVGRLFEDDQPLKGMNEFVTKSAAQFANWIKDGELPHFPLDSRYQADPLCVVVINVKDAEDHFRADDYVNAAAERRPVIYISPNDIYSTHSIISDNLDVIVRYLSSVFSVSCY